MESNIGTICFISFINTMFMKPNCPEINKIPNINGKTGNLEPFLISSSNSDLKNINFY